MSIMNKYLDNTKVKTDKWKPALLIGSYLLLAALVSGCNPNTEAGDVAAAVDTNSQALKSEKLQPQQLYPEVHPDMQPELAAAGKYKVGVKTLDITNEKYVDLLTNQIKPRTLKIEVWYPADYNKGTPLTSYENETRLAKKFSIQANAVRDAAPLVSGSAYPVVVISHGYTGYRQIMFYLGEHLASHGYIVAAIDHTDSTNEDVDIVNAPFNGFPSTLINRSRDQQFTLDFMTQEKHFLSTVVNTKDAGLIGYSMGAFGALNTVGGCYNFSLEQAGMFTGTQDVKMLPLVQKALNSCAAGQYENPKVDDKWKAAIMLAAWGGQNNLFTHKSLTNIQVPNLFVSGNLDDISGYAGIQSLYEKTQASSTYLLTIINARHNIAPHPAPKEAWGSETDFGHYYESAWSSSVLNDINKHFALAMMDCHVKKQTETCDYLNLSQSSDQVQVDGKLPEPWKGFDTRFSTGLRWQQK
ncbi:MAG: putative dienelactone hydrolase [Bermanella sp.]|jgi:predicted dienelactone hydrolase